MVSWLRKYRRTKPVKKPGNAMCNVLFIKIFYFRILDTATGRKKAKLIQLPIHPKGFFYNNTLSSIALHIPSVWLRNMFHYYVPLFVLELYL